MGIRRNSILHNFSKAVNFELYYWQQCDRAIWAYEYFKKYMLIDQDTDTESWVEHKASFCNTPFVHRDPFSYLISSLCRGYESMFSCPSLFSNPEQREVREMMHNSYCSQWPPRSSWQLMWKMQFLSTVFHCTGLTPMSGLGLRTLWAELWKEVIHLTCPRTAFSSVCVIGNLKKPNCFQLEFIKRTMCLCY